MAAPPDTAALIDPVAGSNKENGEGMGMAIPGRINATKHAPNGDEVVPLELPEFDMFSTRKPRNLIAGTSSGLKSVVKGVVGGTVGLIATPIVRAHQDGWPGFCHGLASGLISAVALPVAGAAIGAMQVGRGFINSIEALNESNQGKDWDQTKREWYEYNLEVESERVLSMDDEGVEAAPAPAGAKRLRGGKQPKETRYYDLLGVEFDASADQIKKAYYKKALRLHPDKNPGDEQAKEQFQHISEAYQVLADERLRAKYDAHGQQATSAMNFMDAGVFFTMLFGSDRFEPYIGTLALAAAASMEGQLSLSKLQVKQQKRQVECALELVRLTQRWVDGDTERFRSQVQHEAEELADVSFGDCLLFVVAELYAARAAEFLGYRSSFGGIEGHLAALKGKRASIENHLALAGGLFRAAAAGIKTFKAVKQMQDKAKEGEEEETPAAEGEGAGLGLTPNQLKATQESMPAFLEAMWHMSVIDIEGTLVEVTRKVCKDHAVSEELRKKRAEAIGIMGDIFMQAAVKKGGSKDPRAKVAEMVAMLAPFGPGGGGGEATHEASGHAPAPPPVQQPRAYSVEELNALSIKGLVQHARELGLAVPGGVEKSELVELILERHKA